MTDTTRHANEDGTSQSSMRLFPAKQITPKRKEKMTSQNFLTMYKNTYHENRESEGRPPTPTLSDRESQELQRKYQQTLKNKIKVFEHVLRDIPPVVDNTEMLKTFYRLKVMTSLLFATQYIGDRDADSADNMVKDAMFTAQKSQIELLIAKCEFWHGRVEFLRGNMQLAHSHFLAAHACAMDPEEGVECMDLSFYLDVTRHGISETTRNARLLAHNQAIVAEMPFDKTANNSVSVEKKRKRPIWTWKSAFVEMNQLPVVKQRPIMKIRKPRTRAPTQMKVLEARLAQELENEHITDDHVLGKTLAEELGFDSGDEFDYSGEEYDTETETTDESEDETDSEETSVCSADGATDEAAPNLPEAPGKSQVEETPTAPIHGPTNAPTDAVTDAVTDAATNAPTTAPINASTNATTNPTRRIPYDQAKYEIPKPGSARARFYLQCYQMGLTKSINGKPYVRPKEPFVFGVPHEPTQQTKFTMGSFKVGLEKRARPMTIFPRQPGEIVMTPEEWKSIEKEAKMSIVTYHYLQREREELLRVAGEA
jgi:hypothetical protein